jgi:hypothetical protein
MVVAGKKRKKGAKYFSALDDLYSFRELRAKHPIDTIYRNLLPRLSHNSHPSVSHGLVLIRTENQANRWMKQKQDQPFIVGGSDVALLSVECNPQRRAAPGIESDPISGISWFQNLLQDEED